jgi:hypothetical protein
LRVYRVANNLAPGLEGYIEAPGAFQVPKTNITIPYVEVMHNNFENRKDTI